MSIKIFKKLVILILCMGLPLPTNAAVSVSDGSAFVTKAEFAADLNNLSNRMAQLENSLDAKIDSLVSSYLTRNGIWNGSNQELKNYYIVDCCGSKAANLTAKSVTNGYRDFLGRTQTYTPTVKQMITYPSAMNNDNLLHKVERTTLEIVTECNKTGLLYITFNVATLASVFNTTDDDRTFITFIGGNTSRLTHIQWVMDWLANDNLFYRCEMMYQNTFDRDNSNYMCYTTPYNTFKILSFVSKGDKITLHDYFEFKKNTGAGTVSGQEHAYYAGVIGTVDSCAIY